LNLTVNLKDKSYDIILERGVINNVGKYVNLNRKVLVISDDGVPKQHVDAVVKQCQNGQGFCHIVKQGEGSKSFETYQELCQVLLDLNFSRKDLIIAVGGGVIGDLAGFVAATYMRGINFVNIPTTTLSQIDSSIGGKVAINLANVKNVIGAFYHPKIVLVDSDTLKTLPIRHFNNGLAEAVKSGLIYDAKLFELFETTDIKQSIDQVIYRSLSVKKDIVEKDEKEENLRKTLNFGHTIGHGVEGASNFNISHGAAVAAGMIMESLIAVNMGKLDEKSMDRLIGVLKFFNLYDIKSGLDKKKIFELVEKDKKKTGGNIKMPLPIGVGNAIITSEVTLEHIKGVVNKNIRI